MNRILNGFWQKVSRTENSQGEYMQILGNRIIHYLIPESYHKHIPMGVFFSHKEGNLYNVCYQPDGNVWNREIFFRDQNLIIKADSIEFEFSPVQEEHIPSWFKEALKKSHEKLDYLESADKTPSTK